MSSHALTLLPRDEWLDARASTIGASEIASVIGVSRYKSPADLWAAKTGAWVPEAPGAAAADGLAAEADMVAIYLRRVRVAGAYLLAPSEGEQFRATCDRWPVLSASPDGVWLSEAWADEPRRVVGIVEIKTDRTPGAVEAWPESGEIRDLAIEDWATMPIRADYWLQCQVQMMMTGAPWCDLVVACIQHSAFPAIRVYRIYPKQHRWIGERAAEWWQRHIVDRDADGRQIPPDPINDDDRARLAAWRYPPTKKSRTATPAEDDLIARYIEARDAAKDHERAKVAIGTQLRELSGGDNIKGANGSMSINKHGAASVRGPKEG